MSYLHNFIFGVFPYIALAVFFLGSLIRFDRDQYSWRADSSQFIRRKQLTAGSRLFHMGILLLFFGHFFGLLTPPEIYHVFVDAPTKQLLAMVAGGIFGVVCFIGMTLLVHRRLTDERVRANSKASDIFILLLLYVQLILGLLSIFVSAGHMDGKQMMLLAEWAQRIVTFRAGAAEQLVGVHALYLLHVFVGLIMFLVFPFTRLVHVWSAPFGYIARSYQVVRSRG